MKISGLFALVISMSITSCTIHTGAIGGGSGVITNDQFAVTRLAIGTSKTTQFLGIGGFEKDALVFEAKRNMIQYADMQPGEVIGQTTVDFKRTFFFPIQVNKVTVSSEIIDFSGRPKPTEVPDLYLKAIEVTEEEPVTPEPVREVVKSRYSNAKKSYVVGEEVYYFAGDRNQWVDAKIIGRVGKKYQVVFENKKGQLKQKEVQLRALRAKPDQDQ